MRVRQLTSLATAVCLAGLFGAGQAAAATIGGFGARPAHFDPRLPATRAYFIREIARGGSFSDAVVAFNSGDAPLALRAYPVDGLTGATSGVVYGNRATPLAGAGRWVHVDASEITVPPHGSTTVGFTATAPSDASPGVHLAGLALEEADPSTSGGRFAVTEVLRTVVGIEMNVPGSSVGQVALRSVTPAPKAMTSAAGAGFIVTLSNVGTGLCKPRLVLDLVGSRGGEQVAHTLDTVLPGDTIPYPVAWPHPLSAGEYRETVTAAACGTTALMHANAMIGHPVPAAGPHPSAGHTPAIAITAGSTSPAWWLIVLVGAGGMFLGVVLSRGRHRVRTDP